MWQNYIFLNDFNENFNQSNEEEDNNIYESYDGEKEPINSMYCYINKDLILKKITPIEERSTNERTLLHNFIYNYNSQLKKEEEEEKKIPELCTCDKIIEILSEKKLNKIRENFLIDDKLKNEEKELELSKKKRKRTYNIVEDETKIRYQKGRKKMGDKTERNHNKMSPDNIIKKIKSKIFGMILLFVNNILNQNNKDKNYKKLKDLNYKYINQLNKVIDLDYLGLPLKDLLSKEISPKFKKYQKDYNKKTIENIEKKNNNEIINFVFNMTFREWLDLFTSKIKVTELGYASLAVYEEIEKKLPKLDIILNEIMIKNNEENNNYLSHFIFFLFNYEKWFYNKRKKKQKLK